MVLGGAVAVPPLFFDHTGLHEKHLTGEIAKKIAKEVKGRGIS
jgi:hypothetical protein